MIKFTQHYFDKLVSILAQSNYVVRNEKGNFKSGHCLKEESRIIILNKNAPLESRIPFLCDVIRQVEINGQLLSADERKLVEHLKQLELKV